MPAVATFQYIIDACYDALVDGHGGTRALGASDRFKQGLVPEETNTVSATEARTSKRVWVDIPDMQARDDTQENGSEAFYEVTVRVLCSYYAGEPQRPSELRTRLNTAYDDFRKVRAALCEPGALQTDASANNTGLAGGALIAGGVGTWDRITYDLAARSIKTEMRFRAIVHMTQP